MQGRPVFENLLRPRLALYRAREGGGESLRPFDLYVEGNSTDLDSPRYFLVISESVVGAALVGALELELPFIRSVPLPGEAPTSTGPKSSTKRSATPSKRKGNRSLLFLAKTFLSCWGKS